LNVSSHRNRISFVIGLPSYLMDSGQASFADPRRPATAEIVGKSAMCGCSTREYLRINSTSRQTDITFL